MTATNNIYIIGAGAIGKALAVFLAGNGKNVALVRASVDTIHDNSDEVTINTQSFSVTKSIKVTTLNQLSMINGIVVIATKSHSNAAVAEKLRHKQGTFSVVVMQNGLNVERPFTQLSNVYRCVLFSTSQVLQDGIISFKAVSPSPIGMVNGTSEELATIVNELNTEDFEFRIEADINRFAWEKTIINCAFNSLCPLLEIDNGIFYRNASALGIAREIISEGIALAAEYGVTIMEKAVVDRLLLISQRSDGQLISTYEDIRNKRRTEIDSLNLELARLAAEIGHPELVRVTSALGQIISIRSAATLGSIV
jgi:2-dehydropantoate 2-reductase